MNCDSSSELLGALLDREIDSDGRDELEAHLAGCEACEDRFRSLRAMKHAVARLRSREDLPGAVRARVEGLRFTGSRRSRARAAWLAVALVGALCLVAGAIWLQRARPLTEVLAEQLVLDHERSLPEVKPPEVSSSDPQEVVRFFAARVPFAPVAPALPGARLIGGRLCQLEGRHVQLLFYSCESPSRTLSVFVSDRHLAEDGCREFHGHGVCCRRVGKLTVLAVGRVPGDSLRQILREAKL